MPAPVSQARSCSQPPAPGEGTEGGGACGAPPQVSFIPKWSGGERGGRGSEELADPAQTRGTEEASLKGAPMQRAPKMVEVSVFARVGSPLGACTPAGSALTSAQVNSRFSVYASTRRSCSHTPAVQQRRDRCTDPSRRAAAAVGGRGRASRLEPFQERTSNRPPPTPPPPSASTRKST